MPVKYIQNISKKYNIPVNDLEQYWNEAKNKIKGKNDWGLVVQIFKNILKSKYNINENIKLDFDEFKEIIEEFETQENIPTKQTYNKNIKDKYK